MTTPVDSIVAFSPLAFVLKPTAPGISSTGCSIIAGKRSTDKADEIILQPGVYMFQLEVEMPADTWVSVYRQSPSFRMIGTRTPAARTGYVSFPQKSGVKVYTDIDAAKVGTTSELINLTIIPVPLGSDIEALEQL